MNIFETIQNKNERVSIGGYRKENNYFCKNKLQIYFFLISLKSFRQGIYLRCLFRVHTIHFEGVN